MLCIGRGKKLPEGFHITLGPVSVVRHCSQHAGSFGMFLIRRQLGAFLVTENTAPFRNRQATAFFVSRFINKFVKPPFRGRTTRAISCRHRRAFEFPRAPAPSLFVALVRPVMAFTRSPMQPVRQDFPTSRKVAASSWKVTRARRVSRPVGAYVTSTFRNNFRTSSVQKESVQDNVIWGTLNVL